MKSGPYISVLQLIDGFATDATSGGAAQFGIQIARHLDPVHFRSHVCGLWSYHEESEQKWRRKLHAEGIGTTILMEYTEHLASDMLRALARLQCVIDRVQPDIINSHFERGDLLGICCKVIHSSHPHVVRTMHTEQQWQKRPWLGRLLNIGVFPWLCDKEVAISSTTKAVMDQRVAIRLGRRHQATLLYNGISSEIIQPSAAIPSAPKSYEHIVRIAIIGRIEYQKGHDCFLRAAAIFLQHFPQAEIRIIGTGSLLKEAQTLASTLNIAHSVHFLGQRNDVIEILQEIDLLVSASRWEGFPTVILEAMATHTAVVATDVSGSRELVQNNETGVLVPVDDPVALAQSMIWLIRHPGEAQRMVENAWRHVHQYTLEQTATGYAHLYQTLSGRDGHHSITQGLEI
jgi:glycosyltransferase involved in cell wall biosynthesis